MGKLRVAVSGSAAALLLSLSMMGSAPVRAQAVAIEEEPAPTIEPVDDESLELIEPVDDGVDLVVQDDGTGDNGDNNGEDDPELPPPAATSIANGICGTCSWVIDLDHGLTISPTDGVAGTLQMGDDYGWPWEDYAESITSVSISEGVSAGQDASGMFAFHSALKTADVVHLDVSDAAYLSGMFQGCSQLTSLDLSMWNAGNVVNTQGMFDGCSSLSSLNVAGLVTSSTQVISNMFNGCTELSSHNLYLTGWDASGVSRAGSVFEGCGNLQTLDLSGWNTSQMTDLRNAFKGLTRLKSLKVDTWNVSSVQKMAGMFEGCSVLGSLDLSGWDTQQVTTMNAMFKNCRKLASIGLENWNVASVTDMDSMFYGCKGLTSLDLSQWDTSVVHEIKMGSLFYDCSGIESLNLTGVSTRNATDVAGMFDGCARLNEVTTGKNFSLRPDLPGNNCLPEYYQWRSAKTKQLFDGAEIPEYKADTYTLARGKVTAVITLSVEKQSLNVPLVTGKGFTTPQNVIVNEGPYEGFLSDVTFSNASSNPTARKFAVNSRTGAVSVPAGTAAGTYKVELKAVAPENDTFLEASDTASFALKVKYANPIAVSAKKASVAIAYNASATALGTNVSVGGAKGKLTYANVSQNATAKKFSIDASTGAISVPGGTAVGTYDVAVKVNAAESDGHWAGEGTTTFKVVVNKASSSIRLGDQTKTYTGGALAYTGAVTRSGSAGALTYVYYRDASCKTVVKAAGVKAAGVYYVKATVAASATHAAATSPAAKFTIAKANNPMTVKAKAQTIKAKQLKSKAAVVAPLVVKKAQGQVKYTKVSGSGLISINKKTGKVTVKKKTKAGTYKVKVKVVAAGNANFNTATKTVTIKVVVK